MADNASRRKWSGAASGVWALLALSGVACAPEGLEPAEVAGQQESRVVGNNGLYYNGLYYNGLYYNGLYYNGLYYNGLYYNGLGTAEFSSWFEADPATRANLMAYLVSCAVPAGEERTYTRPGTSETYRWRGELGLAPTWASGQPITLPERQLISACLGARANRYGFHVLISMQGGDVQGNPLPTQPGEADYTVAEGAFFGNLFDGEPVRACNGGLSLGANQRTPRVCALPGEGGGSQCSPMEYVGACQQHCTLDATGRYYEDCYYNGTHYRPLTTWLHPSDVPTCGDGVLHAFEQPGMPGACAADQP